MHILVFFYTVQALITDFDTKNVWLVRLCIFVTIVVTLYTICVALQLDTGLLKSI